MKSTKSYPTLAALFVALLSGPVAFAQTGNSEPAEDVVTLSPFTVNAAADNGYAANNTLAGTRFRTDLKDTPYSISVLTADFLDDIGATNFDNALVYATNAQQEFADSGSDGFGPSNPNGNEFQEGASTFRVRGQPATKARDYFSIRTPFDLYNTERIESARGPNGVLFGFGAPGGILNVSTKQARVDSSFGNATFAVGSFDSLRGTVDVNRTMFEQKFAVRLNLLYDDARSFREYAFDRDKRIHFAATYRLSQTLSFRAEYEHVDIRRNKPRPFASLDGGFLRWNELGRPTTDVIASDLALNVTRLSGSARVTYVGNTGELFNASRTLVTTQPSGGVQSTILDTSIADPRINYGGPGQINETKANIFSAFIEKRFGNNTFLEFAYNHQDQDLLNFNPGQSNMKLWGDPNAVIDGEVNPFAGQIFIETSSGIWNRNTLDTSSDLVRFTFSTELDFEKFGNYQIAALADHDRRELKRASEEEAWVGSPFHANPENSRNGVRRRNYVTEGDWSTYFINSPVTTGLLTNVPDPTTPGGTLSSTWVARSQSQQDDPEKQSSFVLASQARYFDGRLIFSAGTRWDDLEITDRTAQRNPDTNEWSIAHATTTEVKRNAHSYSFGVVGHVTDNISVFFNAANNEGLPGTQRILNIDDLNGPAITAPNSKGEGIDVGVAFRLPNNKLDIRVNYFQSDAVDLVNFYGGTGIGPRSAASNILETLNDAGLISDDVVDARTPNANGAKFDQVSDGYEVSITANLSENLKFRFNYAYTDAKQSNFGLEVETWMNQEIAFWESFGAGDLVTSQSNRTIDEAIAFMRAGYQEFRDLETIGEPGHRKHKLNFFTRYDFSGPLEGAFLGGGYRYQSKNLVGANATEGLAIYGKSVWKADILFGYKFGKEKLQRFGLDGLTLQFNIYNLFDEDDLLLTRVDHSTGNVRRAIVQEPRTWRLQASIDF